MKEWYSEKDKRDKKSKREWESERERRESWNRRVRRERQGG